MTKENGYQYLFGPIPSRRLGISLGIDMIPFKTCSLNCAYCECGKTTVFSLKRENYISAEKIIKELDSFLKKGEKIDVITFAGSGEPTLNSQLPKIFNHIKANYPQINTAILTNSTTLHIKSVQDELLGFDYVLPSLDAVSEEVFKKINNPTKGVLVKDIVQGLTDFSKRYNGTLWVEYFIVNGINDTTDELKKMKLALSNISLTRVQLNTLDRPGAFSWIKPASKESMKKIADYLKPLPVEIISRKSLPNYNQMEANTISKNKIFLSIKRRPLTIEDIAISAKISINQAEIIVKELIDTKKIELTKNGDTVFYMASIP